MVPSSLAHSLFIFDHFQFLQLGDLSLGPNFLFHCLCIYIQVTAVKFRNWLRVLHQFSFAQTVLASSHPHTSDIIPALCRASAIVYNAMMLTKVKLTRSG